MVTVSVSLDLKNDSDDIRFWLLVGVPQRQPQWRFGAAHDLTNGKKRKDVHGLKSFGRAHTNLRNSGVPATCLNVFLF